MAEIKAGYKQTDIGIIPEDWEVKLLGEVSGIVMGQSPLSKFYNTKSIGLPLIQGNADVKNRKTIIRQFSSQITKLGKKGDIILTVRAPVGSVAWATFDCCLGRGVCSIRYPNSYLYYYLQSLEDQWSKYTAGSTFDSINSDYVKAVRFPLPKPDEQKVIAAALSDVDSLIESLEQLIAKKRDIKTATMQQLLTGKKRLPGFKTQGTKQTLVGAIPNDWQVLPLHAVCRKDGLIRGPFGGALKKECFSKSGYKVYTQQNSIYRDEELGNYFVPESKYRELSRFSVKKDDFIISCSGTIGKLHKISEYAPEGIINQALLIIRTNEKISKNYFSIRFCSHDFQSLIIDSTQGGAMQNLVGMSVFRKTPIILPGSQEQEAISSVILDMDVEIAALEQRLEKVRSLKTGMMQELLTGKTRLMINGE